MCPFDGGTLDLCAHADTVKTKAIDSNNIIVLLIATD